MRIRQMNIGSVPETWDASKNKQHLKSREDRMVKYFRDLKDKAKGRYNPEDLALRCQVTVEIVKSWEKGKMPPLSAHAVIAAYERALLALEPHQKTSFPSTKG